MSEIKNQNELGVNNGPFLFKEFILKEDAITRLNNINFKQDLFLETLSSQILKLPRDTDNHQNELNHILNYMLIFLERYTIIDKYNDSNTDSIWKYFIFSKLHKFVNTFLEEVITDEELYNFNSLSEKNQFKFIKDKLNTDLSIKHFIYINLKVVVLLDVVISNLQDNDNQINIVDYNNDVLFFTENLIDVINLKEYCFTPKNQLEIETIINIISRRYINKISEISEAFHKEYHKQKLVKHFLELFEDSKKKRKDTKTDNDSDSDKFETSKINLDCDFDFDPDSDTDIDTEIDSDSDKFEKILDKISDSIVGKLKSEKVKNVYLFVICK